MAGTGEAAPVGTMEFVRGSAIVTYFKKCYVVRVDNKIHITIKVLKMCSQEQNICVLLKAGTYIYYSGIFVPYTRFRVMFWLFCNN